MPFLINKVVFNNGHLRLTVNGHNGMNLFNHLFENGVSCCFGHNEKNEKFIYFNIDSDNGKAYPPTTIEHVIDSLSQYQLNEGISASANINAIAFSSRMQQLYLSYLLQTYKAFATKYPTPPFGDALEGRIVTTGGRARVSMWTPEYSKYPYGKFIPSKLLLRDLIRSDLVLQKQNLIWTTYPFPTHYGISNIIILNPDKEGRFLEGIKQKLQGIISTNDIQLNFDYGQVKIKITERNEQLRQKMLDFLNEKLPQNYLLRVVPEIHYDTPETARILNYARASEEQKQDHLKANLHIEHDGENILLEGLITMDLLDGIEPMPTNTEQKDLAQNVVAQSSIFQSVSNDSDNSESSDKNRKLDMIEESIDELHVSQPSVKQRKL